MRSTYYISDKTVTDLFFFLLFTITVHRKIRNVIGGLPGNVREPFDLGEEDGGRVKRLRGLSTSNKLKSMCYLKKDYCTENYRKGRYNLSPGFILKSCFFLFISYLN